MPQVNRHETLGLGIGELCLFEYICGAWFIVEYVVRITADGGSTIWNFNRKVDLLCLLPTFCILWYQCRDDVFDKNHPTLRRWLFMMVPFRAIRFLDMP